MSIEHIPEDLLENSGESPLIVPTFGEVVWCAKLPGWEKPRDVHIGVVYPGNPDNLAAYGDIAGILPGYGEEIEGTTAAVRKVGEAGLVSVGIILPFDKKKFPGIDHDQGDLWVEMILKEGLWAAVDEINERAGRPADTPFDMQGHSQGGGAVMLATDTSPERAGIIVARSPAGINDLSNGPRSAAREITDFAVGMGRNAFHPDQTLLDAGNRRGAFEVGRRALIDIATGRLVPKLGWALARADGVGVAKRVSDRLGADFAIYMAEDDGAFPPEPKKQILRAAGVDVERVVHMIEGSHTLHAGEASRRQIEQTTGYILVRRLVRQAWKDAEEQTG